MEPVWIEDFSGRMMLCSILGVIWPICIMEHDFSKVFDTDNPLWQEVLAIFEENKEFPTKRVRKRALHHKYPRSFCKLCEEPVDNDKDNLISISFHDHFMLHYYYYVLAKPKFKSLMALAFRYMVDSKVDSITNIESSELASNLADAYEQAKIESIEFTANRLKGRSIPDEQRAKISATLTGRKRDPEIARKAARTRNARTGGHWTPEQRAHLSEVRRGKPHPLSEAGRQSIIEKNRARMLGTHASEETRRKMSLTRKGRKDPRKNYRPSEETKRKISETLKAKHIVRSPETREKMSAAQKGKIVSQETRDKLRAANKRRQPSTETRQKLHDAIANRTRDSHGRLVSVK
jgi:hypothetical protein